MKIIVNKHKWLPIPFTGYRAINLFGFLVTKKPNRITEKTIRHECIHTAQMKEMLYVPFYIVYFIEYIIRIIAYGLRFIGRAIRDKERKFRLALAYRKISFEQEAYANEDALDYLKHRGCYCWIKYI